jgi:hypothetical protein
MNPWRRIFIGAFCSLFLAGGLALAIYGTPDNRADAILSGLSIMLMGAGLFWLIDRSRLQVSSSGVKMRILWISFETPWQNVESLRLERRWEAFVTAAPVDKLPPFVASGTAYNIERRRLRDEKRLFPIDAFSWHLRHGLAEDLGRFAPQLQTTVDSEAPARIPIGAAIMTPAFLIILFFVPNGRAILIVIALPFGAVFLGLGAVKAFRGGRIWSGLLYAILFIVEITMILGLIQGMRH